MQFLIILTFINFCFVLATAKLSPVLPGQIALYWGQATDTPTLEETCADDGVDIVILSFLNVYPDPMEINLWPAECYPETSDGSWTYTCDGTDGTTDIVSGIKYCQNLGKKVMLSIGGSTGSSELTSDAEGVTFADDLWKYFGPDNNSSITRPFGDAVIDGFDFDIEGGSSTGLVATANELRSKFSEDSSKTYYLSAAPQCPENDAYVGPLLNGADIDFAFIQFYNNYCSLSGSSFNWEWWADWANTTSKNKDIKLFLGLPGSSAAAPSGGYVEPSVVSTALTDDILPESSNFGGIMLWNAYYATNNVVDDETYLDAMADLLNTTSAVSSTATSSSSSSSSSSSASSSSASSSSTLSLSSTTSSTPLSSVSSSSPLSLSSSSFSPLSSSSSSLSLSSSFSSILTTTGTNSISDSTSSSSLQSITSTVTTSTSIQSSSGLSLSLAASFTLSNTTRSLNPTSTSMDYPASSSLSSTTTTQNLQISSSTSLNAATFGNISESGTSIDYWRTVTISSNTKSQSSTISKDWSGSLPTISSISNNSSTEVLAAPGTTTVKVSTYIFPTFVPQNSSSEIPSSIKDETKTTETEIHSLRTSSSDKISVPTSAILSFTTRSVGAPNQYFENYNLSSSISAQNITTSTITSIPCSTESSSTIINMQSEYSIPTTQAAPEGSSQLLSSNVHPTLSLSTLLYSSVSSQNFTTPSVYNYEGMAPMIQTTSLPLLLVALVGVAIITL